MSRKRVCAQGEGLQMGRAAINGLADSPGFCWIENLSHWKSWESAYEFQAGCICMGLFVQRAWPGGAVLCAHGPAAHLMCHVAVKYVKLNGMSVEQREWVSCVQSNKQVLISPTCDPFVTLILICLFCLLPPHFQRPFRRFVPSSSQGVSAQSDFQGRPHFNSSKAHHCSVLWYGISQLQVMEQEVKHRRNEAPQLLDVVVRKSPSNSDAN